MRHLLLILTAEVLVAAPPQFRVENKCPATFTVTNAIPVQQTPSDPYGVPDYAAFRARITGNVRGVLVVGVPDRFVGGYQFHCRVASGFAGLADGEYDCWEENGRPVMQLRSAAPGVAAPQPFRGLAYNPTHTCPSCGRAQYIISGSGPVPGTHTHTCASCGTSWYH